MFSGARRFVKLLVIVAVIALFVMFAVDNREYITLSLFPLPYAADLPKFLLAMLCFAIGIITGGLAVGAQYLKARRLFRAEHQRAMALQDELKHVQTEQDAKLPAVPGH